jgi:hypothetical protein
MYTMENHNSVLGIREYFTMKNMLNTGHNSIFWIVNTMYCIVILARTFYNDSVFFLVSSLIIKACNFFKFE